MKVSKTGIYYKYPIRWYTDATITQLLFPASCAEYINGSIRTLFPEYRGWSPLRQGYLPRFRYVFVLAAPARNQKKVDISHNLQYLCTPNQKVYHLQQLGGQPSGTFSSPSPMRKARMAESVDALVSNTSGAIRAGSIPAPGTFLIANYWISMICDFSFRFCTTFAPQNGCFGQNKK